jgi:chitin disaccharide deacetylase
MASSPVSALWYAGRLLLRLPSTADHPDLSLGLHFDLGEWAYREETWVPVYQVVPVDDVAAVADELARQLATFRYLTGHDPTHLDSHQHIHRWEPVRSVLVEAAHRLAVPLRHFAPKVHYCGCFYEQTGKGSPLPEAISVNRLLEILEGLAPGLTELGCHPGEGNDLDSMYSSERSDEVKVLCDPRIRSALTMEGIELCSFHNFTTQSMGIAQ